ncbi:hypothetical protein PV04_03179 [Phialophora macrospora]|uniref:Uncharacterized protein n=1 Tax=Phialophora macrospora TaxID=1851006 RepID=A0A0D2E9F8_9EURO|nr:hypothetical protein PV04_03179 [Phialophora macrospora]
MTVALGRPELRDAAFGEFLLQRHCFQHFAILALDEILPGRWAVEALEYLLRDVVAPFDNMVPGRLGDQPDQEELDHRGKRLQDTGQLPRPLALHFEGPVRGPAGNDRPEIPQGIVDRGELGAVLRVRELRDEHGRAALRVDDAEADDEAGGNEHSDIDADGLQDDAQEDQRAAHQDGPLAPDVIREIGHQRQSHDLSDREDGVE